MIKFSPKDKKMTWQFIVARKFSPFYEYFFANATGLGHDKNILGYEHSYRRIDLNGELFYCRDDVISEQKKVLKQMKNNIKLVARRGLQAEKEGEKLMRLAQAIRSKNPDKQTVAELKKTLLDFFAAFRRFIPFLMMPLTIEAYLERELDKYLIKKYRGNGEKIKGAKSLILTSARENLQEKEQISILKLAEEFKNRKKITDDLDKKVKAYLDKFAVLGLRYGVGDIWQKKDIIPRIRLLSKNNLHGQRLRLIHKRKKIEKRFGKIINELKPDKRAREIIRIIREYIYLRTYRTNILNNSLGTIKPFLEKIAKKLNTDWGTLNHMILPEVLESLDLDIVPEKFSKQAKKRKAGFATIFINHKFHIFTGRDIDRFAAFFNLKTKIKGNSGLIKGVVANTGKVRGIVKIVFTPADNEKVNHGDILVASMTTPNFVPAMEKAAAFVTDEGGILCHAAIVSREMKKPCIIGTKIATKVLKDGDLVEVDANEGIVKVIK